MSHPQGWLGMVKICLLLFLLKLWYDLFLRVCPVWQQISLKKSDKWQGKARLRVRGVTSKKLETVILSFQSNELTPIKCNILLVEQILPTSWYGKYPVIYRVSYKSGGKEFSSTVDTHLKFNSSPVKSYLAPKGSRIISQASFFRVFCSSTSGFFSPKQSYLKEDSDSYLQPSCFGIPW